MQGPADVAVEEVHSILRQIVARTIESEDCKGLAQFSLLKREIATTAATSLEGMREDARKMVQTIVEMESSYLTAEVFKEILQQSSSQDGETMLLRTLSGRPVSLFGLFVLRPSASTVSSGKNRAFMNRQTFIKWQKKVHDPFMVKTSH